MAQVIQVDEVGGPEVLRVASLDVPEPGPNEIRIRHKAVGLNFIDVYYRTGVYKAPSLPFVPGLEGAGVVEAAGADVRHLRPGDRVAYAGGPLGAYAEQRVFPADRAIRLPEDIAHDTAAAMMLKGMTAQYLLRQTYKVQPGDTILFHAAAGGVGLLACQWAHQLGATVIGTVGSDEKAAVAKSHGCDHVINYKRENFVDRVAEITNGRKVAAVYDGVGAATFDGSLECLRPRGIMVLFGQSSGKVPPFDLAMLAAKGSLYITRPSLFAYTAARADLEACAADLIEVVRTGGVKIPIGSRRSLEDVQQAHRDLEARKTTGATVLIV